MLRLTTSMLLIVYLGTRLDWKLVASLKIDFIFYFILAVIFFLFALLIMSLRWKIIIDHEIGTKAPISYLYRFYLIGSFFSAFLPTAIGGDVVRIAYSNKNFGFGLKRSSAIVTSERLFGLSAIASLFSLGFLLDRQLLQSLGITAYYGFVSLLLAAVIFFIARHLATKRIKISLFVSVLLLLLSICGQFGDILIVYGFAAHYFNLNVSLTSLMVIMPVVYVATILPISFGGLGVREGTMVALLAFLHVNSSIAILIAFSLYLSKLTVGLLGAVLYNREKNQVG